MVGAAPTDEEAPVSLGAGDVPAVAGVAERAKSTLDLLRFECAGRTGRYLGSLEVDERLVRSRVDGEAASVPSASCFEVLEVVAEPAQVVVEGSVLHHHDDDGVDRALGRRVVEDAVWRRQHSPDVARSGRGPRRLQLRKAGECEPRTDGPTEER